MNFVKKLFSFAFVMSFAVACSPIFFQGSLHMNDVPGVAADDGGTGVEPTGNESEPTTTFGQLSDGQVRVEIPLSVLGVAIEELDSVAVDIVAEDDDTRAYELEPAALYQEASDAIVFVVNQLDDGDLLTVTLTVNGDPVTFSASVSLLSETVVAPSS